MKTRTTIKKFLLGTGIFLFGLFALQTGASATTITHSLGNTGSGFLDGDIPAVSQVGTAQSGQFAPFNQSFGNDIFSGNYFDVGWTFSFAPIADTIIGATINFGIFDHDTSATGSQLDLFTVDGNALTTTLDGMFEAGGGSSDGEYNVYSINLGGLFSDLSDGTVDIKLTLQGPGLVTPLFPLPGPNPPEDSLGNGANLIFSTLTIETSASQPQPIPEPGSLVLTLFGLSVMGFIRRRG